MKIPARLRVLCQADQGVALVELAFVVPFLLILVAGAVDLGRAYYVYLDAVNAAHSGAEYGSQYPANTANIITAATPRHTERVVDVLADGNLRL